MRRDAKRSSQGPSRRPKASRRFILTFFSVLVLLIALASTALALQTHGKGDDLQSPSGGVFSYRGLAVDQSGGDVYAVDLYDPNTFAHGMLHRFHADGSSDATFDTATASLSETLAEPQDVAIDNSGGSTDGRIYVADTAHNRVLAIDESGAPIAAFGTSGQINGSEDSPGDPDTLPTGGFSSPCGLALDSANGNLFVADQNNNRIWIFDSSGAYLNKIVDSSLNGPCGIAFNSTGDLYVRNANDGKVLRFNRQSATAYDFASVLYSPEAEPNATDVAVDTATDHAYVDKGDRISEYDASGSPVSTFAQEQINGSSGIAVDSANAKLYASSGNRIATFGQLITVPDVSTGEATDVSDETATLRGSVDPAGLDTTDCHFEYDTAPYAAGGPPHGTEIECLAGDVIPAAGGGPVEVGAPVTGLASGTEYHFRLVVANAEGQNQGQDQSFTTVGPPTVSRTFVTEVSAKAATLNADLNSNGAATSYRFEYVEDAAFQATGFSGASKTPDANLDAGASSLTVSASLSGLQPSTRYHYRLVASNFAGPLTGPERIFKTDSISGSATSGQFPGQGFLPDNRAWEMVSPPDKNGSGVRAGSPRTVVSPDGQRVSYAAPATFGDVRGTGQVGDATYVATRGAGGWSSHALTPQSAPGWDQVLLGTTRILPSENVTRAIVQAFDLPESSDDISEGITNLYRVDADGSHLSTLTVGSSGTNPLFEFGFGANSIVGGSDNDSRIFFSSVQPLLPEAAPGVRNVYEWDEGTLRLAGVLPDGSVPPGGSQEIVTDVTASHLSANEDTVSDDGSRAIFRAVSPGLSEQLYMRRNHTDTVWVSEAEGSTPVADPQGVTFLGATPDLHRVAFSSQSQLNDEDPGGSGGALYIYTDSPNPENEDNLKFIYRGGATVLGMSVDGSGGYWLENGKLFHWDESGVQVAIDADVNASLPVLGDIEERSHTPEYPTRVSADGTRIAFLHRGSQLTEGELGREPAGERFPALYVYDSDTGKLACASCPPSGAATTGETVVWPHAGEDEGIKYNVKGPRFLTADGRRVFFSTPDALVPEDVNGRYDAYEYDIDSGEPHLLSSGHSPSDSWFSGASASGDDAFFVTLQALSGNDVDNAKDVYDARVDGGLPEPLPAPPACQGDACQPPPTQLNDPTPSSESFAGQANVKAKKHKRHRARKQHGAKRKHAHKKQRANGNRRAGK